MPEEGAHEGWISSNLSKLLVNSRPQLFAFLQRALCNACALDVTPHRLIRIEVWRVTRQKVQSQFSLRAVDVFFDNGFLRAGNPSTTR